MLGAGSPEFELLRPAFPDYAGVRCIIHAAIERVSDSCGYAVPRMELKGQRDTLIKWSEGKGANGLEEYRRQKNARSINGDCKRRWSERLARSTAPDR